MMDKNFKIVFMGTPAIAVNSLEILNKHSYEVVLVVTKPDRPKGRGKVMTSPPVKEAALKSGYKIIQPESVKNDDFFKLIKNVSPDIFVVFAFGEFLPKTLLEIPKFGAINIHTSLLPKYRGAAPIQWAIINCETETGVTSILMNEILDGGDILLKSKVKINSDDNIAKLSDKLSIAAADLLINTLNGIQNNLIPVKQDESQATKAPLLKKADGRIDWKKSAKEIDAFIRGVNPWPGAFTMDGEKYLKILKAKPIDIKTSLPPGTVLERFDNELLIAAGSGAVSIIEIQNQSGKRLKIQDFLMGCNMKDRCFLES